MGIFDFFKKRKETTLLDDMSIKDRIEALKSSILGMEFLQDDKYQKAKECFDIAIEKGLKKAITYKYRGFCFQKDNMHYKALDDFSQSLLLDPDDWETYYFRITSLDILQRYEEKLFDLNRIIKLLHGRKDLDDEKSGILSSCQINLKYTIQLDENQKELNKLHNEWEEKLKEVRENTSKRNAENNKNNK